MKRITIWNLAIAWFLISLTIFVLQLVFNQRLRNNIFGIGLPAESTSYQSERYGFYIEFPETWSIGETPQGDHGDQDVISVIFSAGMSLGPKAFMYIRAMPTLTALEKLIEHEEQKTIELPGYHELELSTFSTPRFHGTTRKYQYKTAIFLICRNYNFVIDDIGYSLQGCAKEPFWNQSEDVFRQIVDSFDVR